MPDSDAQPHTRTDRIPIWSVSERTRDVYFYTFTVLYSAGLVILAIGGDGGDPARPILEKVIAYWTIAGAMAIAAAAVSMVISETGGTLMVLLDRAFEARDRQRKEFIGIGLAKGREEERVKRERLQHEWEDWHARMEKARAAGLPFDDPPPTLEANGASERSA